MIATIVEYADCVELKLSFSGGLLSKKYANEIEDWGCELTKKYDADPRPLKFNHHNGDIFLVFGDSNNSTIYKLSRQKNPENS